MSNAYKVSLCMKYATQKCQIVKKMTFQKLTADDLYTPLTTSVLSVT